ANERSWQLNAMPIVLAERDWQALAEATVQRARLSDRIVSDVYGDQALLKSGAIPAELVFADPAYLAPAAGTVKPDGALTFFAVDFARGRDGQWRAIDTHTETVAGIGYVIANRIAMTHVLGDVFTRSRGLRIAAFFEQLQAELGRASGSENPRLALLTPGPNHPDYFAQAYLARYLGLILVEGLDLRTTEDRVALKTLEGLKDIDLIVRCIDGATADPLLLDSTQFNAPPGLLDVARARPQSIVNAIGSAVAQNRGLGPLLTTLCRDILGEDLLMPDASRIWLGDEAGRARVLADPDRYTIRSAQEQTGRPGQAEVGRAARGLTGTERDDLIREIALHGPKLVAEEPGAFATAPALNGNTLKPTSFALRMFAVRARDTFRVLPGGLAMTINQGEAIALSAPEGLARDVWVVSDAPQEQHSSLWTPAVARARVERSGRVLQSRVADNLFWLGRFAERADWTLRVTRSALRRLQEDGGVQTGRRAARRVLGALMLSAGEQLSHDAFGDSHVADDIEAQCIELLRGQKLERALPLTCQGLYRNAAQTRDRLSLEAWHILSGFSANDPWMRSISNLNAANALGLIECGLDRLSAFNGLMHENMTRNHGWTFLDMGRRVERTFNLSETIRAALIPAPDPAEERGALLLILDSADSFVTYRSRYRLDPMAALVLDLLVLDEQNPRSLGFQLEAIARHLASLPEAMEGASRTEARRDALALRTAVQLVDVDVLTRDPDRTELSHLLQTLLNGLPQLSSSIARQYFNLASERLRRAPGRGRSVAP
ncbi:MAG: circularly permuted type 2 ATP-grasp protein, partial [Pseudomonadota bacterium]